VVRKIVDGGVRCGFSEDVNIQLGWFSNDILTPKS